MLHFWDILCPSCRIPADVQKTLASLKDHAYCPACDLKYDIDFASSVELIFRAHPEVRQAETKTCCIGGTAFSAHVVAQIRLAPGERVDLEVTLSEGLYRLRSPQLPFTIELTVSAGRGATRSEFSILRLHCTTRLVMVRPLGEFAVSLFTWRRAFVSRAVR